MSPRGGQPLFDLITNRRDPDRRDPERRPEPRDEPRRGPTATTGKLIVPVPWIYAAGGGVLVLLLLAYGVGYQNGASAERAERQARAQRDADEIFIDDPLRKEGTGDDTPADQATPAPPRPADPDAGILTARGVVEADPREPGHNYLELATLPRAQADDAVRYLAAQGIDAIGVPVLDRGRRSPNTSDRFRVVALDLAISGERFSSTREQRERFERRLARLGAAWAEMGGASDFSDPLWRKYGG